MYENFKKINGTHPWRDVGADGYIDYPVRYRKGGRVLYFNFDLAKELTLIPKNHPARLNAKLEEIILKTFSIQILNEHDWMNRKTLPKDGYEDRLYMATRYLQSQHENKQGKTSGDGRSIWNGCIDTGSKTFDISSCGTGSTILSPGAQDADEPIQTGSEKYGYASGLADVDEMLSGAVMSEIFYREGYPSERCLAVIGFADKTGIGVRTAPNLVRPAHFFRYLKLNQYDDLKASVDYFLDRQVYNKSMDLPQKAPHRYNKALESLARTYAKLAAVMEEEYIFNWLAWDGDNLLADGSILDYGSIRQFAAKHNKYRYEDVDRFSTCLTEQKYWARKIIQTMAQVMDYIITKEKKPLDQFDDHKVLKLFDEEFWQQRYRRMLWRVGFSLKHIDQLLSEQLELVQAFHSVLNYFEDIKTIKGEQRVPDGINHPPVFLVRHMLRILPKYLLEHYEQGKEIIMPAEDFCLEMAATYVDKEDLRLNDYRMRKSAQFQKLYRELIVSVSPKVKSTLKTVARRSSVINYEHRKTGDGLSWIVGEAIRASKKMSENELQSAIRRFIESQVLVPNVWKPIKDSELHGKSMKSRLLQKMQENLELYNETI